jgi:cytochrome c biogenesis protein
MEIAGDKVWKFFSSVKLAVALLIILAIVSIIGTVIQQNEAPEQYLQEYSQSTIQLFDLLGFFDMYHTLWFVFLLFMLTINLTICSLERFPYAWKIIKAPMKILDDESLQTLPFKKEIMFKGDMDKAQGRAVEILTARWYRVSEFRDAGTLHITTQKGIYSRLGVYITHASIILIVVGALIGSFFGFKAFMNLPEGTAQKGVYVRNEPLWDKIMSSLGIAESSVQLNPQTEMPTMPLGFFVQCDNFDVDYYMNSGGMPTGMPSEYHSTLSIYDLRGRKILDKRISVNDPLTYNGITFYQSSYGTIPDSPGNAVLNIRPKNAAGAGETIIIALGGSQYVRSIDRTIKVLGFAPFGIRDIATGQVVLYTTANEEYINPAIQLRVFNGKKPVYTTELLKTDQGTPYMPENYTISFVHYGGTRYTGLQVTKDPGVWVVYTGFILLCVGPIVAFFGSHKKLWVKIQDRKGHQTVVTVAGTANKNRIGFEREFNSIVDGMAK